MNTYAGVLLLNCTNYGAFLILRSFLRIPVIRAAFTGNLDGLKVYGDIFMALLKNQSSKLYNHLTKSDYPIVTYVFDAAASMYANNFPLEVTVKLWDIIMESPELMMMRVGISIFKSMEKTILSKTKEEIMMMVKYPCKVIEEEVLLKTIAKTTIKPKDYEAIKKKLITREEL